MALEDFFARIGSTEENNIRIGHRFNTDICSSVSNIDIGSVNTWSTTRGLRGIFFAADDNITINFNVTSRTDLLILGTFSGEFTYPVYINNKQERQNGGRVIGVWQLKPRSEGLPNGGAFPKCVTNTYDYCRSNGIAYSYNRILSNNALDTGLCDWKSEFNNSRPGEWLGLP